MTTLSTTEKRKAPEASLVGMQDRGKQFLATFRHKKTYLKELDVLLTLIEKDAETYRNEFLVVPHFMISKTTCHRLQNIGFKCCPCNCTVAEELGIDSCKWGSAIRLAGAGLGHYVDFYVISWTQEGVGERVGTQPTKL